MFRDIVALYRASKKKKDINWFTEWVARPPAAVVVYFLAKTRVTPNQVTLLSLVVCAGAAAMFALLPGYAWLLAAIAVFEFSFVLDCADGQLARVRKIASPLGHLLDFLMDEIKAMMVMGAVTIRVWRETGYDDRVMLLGMGALFCLAAGLSLTSFTRRPEYGAKPPTEDGQPAVLTQGTSLVARAIGALEWVARIFVHYPQYIWICAVLNRMDIFLWCYAAVNVLYLGKTFLAIAWRLGRFAPPQEPAR